MDIIQEIRSDVKGAQVLADWIGEGVPVSEVWASHRAMACLSGNNGKECPHHKSPHWWELSKLPVADFIKQQIELKSKMRLSTPYDDKLKMCGACGCALSVKIWVPIKHIVAHTLTKQLDLMPAYCWQRREANIA